MEHTKYSQYFISAKRSAAKKKSIRYCYHKTYVSDLHKNPYAI